MASLSIYAGRRILGTVEEEAKARHVARDADRKRLGTFATRARAVAAVDAAAKTGATS